MDNDAATRRKATEYGGWVGDTILRLMEERDAARAHLTALQPYCWHIPGCVAVMTPGLPCDCGYIAVFNAIYVAPLHGRSGREDER